jgi:hypothetical protein
LEITGITRLKDGKEVEEFVVGHADHNYWFKGRPPLMACAECWHAYFYAQWALAGAIPEHLDQLESAIHHMKEQIENGEWDFKPELNIESIQHEN